MRINEDSREILLSVKMKYYEYYMGFIGIKIVNLAVNKNDPILLFYL